MKLGGFFCSCSKTSNVNFKKVKKSLKDSFEVFVSHDLLCTGEGLVHIIDYARSDLMDAVLIGCTEMNKFEPLAEELGLPFHYINLREYCGWVHGKKEATEKAIGMISAEIEALQSRDKVLPYTLDTGSVVLFIGNSPDLFEAAQILSGVADVKILAKSLAEAGPAGLGMDIYLGELRDIKGEVGDFTVSMEPGPINFGKCISCGKCSEACPKGAISHWQYHITEECDLCRRCCDACPVDAISFDRKLGEVKAGQIIIADNDKKVRETEGIYRVDVDRRSIFEAALKAVINRGKIVKPLAVEADLANCAAGKSGLVGCTLCESACIHGAVARDGDRISYTLGSCKGCGACAAVCPVSIPIFKIAPRKVIHQQIKNLLRARVKKKVILFTCERRGELLEALGRERREYYPVLPLLVPCLNTISELEILAAYAMGADGVILLGCVKCLHGSSYDNAVDFSDAVLQAFKLGERLLPLRSTDPEKFTTQVGAFVESLPKSGIVLHGPIDVENKRMGLLDILSRLSQKTGVVPHETMEGAAAFGLISVDDSRCTLCNTCTVMCPLGAVKKEGDKLIFSHALCIACGLCVKSCPEKAMILDKSIDFKRLIDRREEVACRGEILECPACGKATISKNALRVTVARLGEHSPFDPELLKYCPDCRALKSLGFTGGEDDR